MRVMPSTWNCPCQVGQNWIVAGRWASGWDALGLTPGAGRVGRQQGQRGQRGQGPAPGEAPSGAPYRTPLNGQ